MTTNKVDSGSSSQTSMTVQEATKNIAADYTKNSSIKNFSKSLENAAKMRSESWASKG